MFPYCSFMIKSRIIGFDPSLVSFGWGIIDAHGMKIKHVAHGVIKPVSKNDLHIRLRELFVAITEIIKNYSPEAAAVEEAFMKNNPASAIKLGHARAACLIPSSLAGIDVGEYSPRSVKKSVVGTGAADKSQVAHMINVLLPYSKVVAGDAADALAVAICHSQNMNSLKNIYGKAS